MDLDLVLDLVLGVSSNRTIRHVERDGIENMVQVEGQVQVEVQVQVEE